MSKKHRTVLESFLLSMDDVVDSINRELSEDTRNHDTEQRSTREDPKVVVEFLESGRG